ncbi:hypothetical protein BRC81_11590 [Halobacteriales archaeon QS_1_68_20]|nr:MAG: hypothetical protein BRC81_11590 [Halobacteriales archaeon QS_1_68_20]
MARLRLTGVLGTSLIALLALGSLVIRGESLVEETAAMAVVVLVLVVFFGLGAYGERFAKGGTSYW